jgi:hypothetical protein
MSQNRNHLVPTTIVNKNGVRTTVHKKPATEPTASTKLPSATLPTTITDREQLERATAETLANLDYGPPTTELEALDRAHNYQRLLAVLHPYSDETLHRFAATATTDIGADLNDFLVGAEADEEYVNDWITIEPTVLQEGGDSVPILVGLKKYENLTPQKNGHYPLRRIEEVLAITRVTIHLEDLGHGFYNGFNDEGLSVEYIEDDKLRDLLTTHENPTAIADIITQRDITDADQIIMLLDTMDATANAINDGAL